MPALTVNTVDTITVTGNGNLYEAQGIRNREEAGKRVIQLTLAGAGTGTGTLNVPLTFYDHDYRVEDTDDNQDIGLYNFRKHYSMMDQWDVIPNYGIDATLGTYHTITNLNVMVDSGSLYREFKFKWIYSINNRIEIMSNSTSHGELNYDAATTTFTYTYPNIGLINLADTIVYLVWVENSNAWVGTDHLFILNKGGGLPIISHYGFYRITRIVNNNQIELQQETLSAIPVIERPFFDSQETYFEDMLGLPGGNFANNQCILYDLGYYFFKNIITGQDCHVLAVTGYENTSVTGINDIRSYNDIMLFTNTLPTIINDGGDIWYNQAGVNTDVTLAFLAPIGNYIDFNIVGGVFASGSESGALNQGGQFIFNIMCNCIGATEYFGSEQLKVYSSQTICVGPSSAPNTFVVNTGASVFNIKMHLRGLPIILAKIVSSDINITFTGEPRFTDVSTISLNSIDCRRRI